MTQIDEPSQHRQASKVVVIDIAARRRLAVRAIILPAAIAALATLTQIYDGFSGRESWWSACVSFGITAWWTAIAIYLNDRRPREQ